MIEVINLSKKYKKAEEFSLKQADFTLKRGEMAGLIGANGAGKSTLMKTMCKFISPTEGTVKINGEDLYSKDYLLKDVGILLEPVFFPQLSAYENMEYYLKIHGKKEFLPSIEEHLEMVGLLKDRDKKVKSFSFGMKQRLGLALALSGKPKMLILDEPFVGLDPNGMKDLIKILHQRVKEDQIAALVSSHQLHELSAVCERVLVIQKGVIVFDGVPNDSPEITIELDREYTPTESFKGRVSGRTITTRFKEKISVFLWKHCLKNIRLCPSIQKNQLWRNFFRRIIWNFQ